MRVEDEEQRVLVVTSVRNAGRQDGTYNLTVADFHTYFVGELNVLVHNCKVNTNAPTKNAAFRNAKRENGVPTSQQPDKTIKPGTPEGDRAGLGSRNVKQTEHTNGKGQKISIRQDKATDPAAGKGKQPDHFNAGPKGEKLRQHHNVDPKT